MTYDGYEAEKKLVGHIGVDAGLCWLGDPCYVLPEDRDENVGRDWMAFVKEIGNDDWKEFRYNAGHKGVGCVVSTGYGDGMYPVFVTLNDEGRVAKVEVVFVEEDDDEEFDFA